MTRPIDGTHLGTLQSWVDSANDPSGDFPIQNLPFAAFARRGGGVRRVGVAIGDQLLDLGSAADRNFLEGLGAPTLRACRAEHLGPLLELGPAAWAALRARLSDLLREGRPPAQRPVGCLLPQAEVTLGLPAEIRDYTDFYASLHHARNVGRLFRPDQPLLPNYAWIPIGYHGRTSSLVPSGTPVRRPRGQTMPDGAPAPTFGSSQALDYEAELGMLVGPGNRLGSAVPLPRAEEHLFGCCLVNDWSARDIQKWEYQPLGPFLGKSFATTVSPWVVTLEALAPFRSPRPPREAEFPEPLAYLDDPGDRAHGALDIAIEVRLRSRRMEAEGVPPMVVSRGTARDLFWTPAQMLAHHTSNGCNLRPGDLLASGTISGATAGERGCLLERTARGAEPLTLPTGESRRFLEDGDEVFLSAWCEREGFARIGFGECRGVVVATDADGGAPRE